MKTPVMNGNPIAISVCPALCSSTESFPVHTVQCLTVLLAQVGRFSSLSEQIQVHTELY